MHTFIMFDNPFSFATSADYLTDLKIKCDFLQVNWEKRENVLIENILMVYNLILTINCAITQNSPLESFV